MNFQKYTYLIYLIMSKKKFSFPSWKAESLFFQNAFCEVSQSKLIKMKQHNRNQILYLPILTGNLTMILLDPKNFFDSKLFEKCVWGSDFYKNELKKQLIFMFSNVENRFSIDQSCIF